MHKAKSDPNPFLLRRVNIKKWRIIAAGAEHEIFTAVEERVNGYYFAMSMAVNHGLVLSLYY